MEKATLKVDKKREMRDHTLKSEAAAAAVKFLMEGKNRRLRVAS
jgi:hypothetical protein